MRVAAAAVAALAAVATAAELEAAATAAVATAAEAEAVAVWVAAARAAAEAKAARSTRPCPRDCAARSSFPRRVSPPRAGTRRVLQLGLPLPGFGLLGPAHPPTPETVPATPCSRRLRHSRCWF